MKIPLFDGHCDTLFYLTRKPQEQLSTSHGQWSLEKIGCFGPMAQFFALYWDSALPFYKMMVKREYKVFQQECKRNAGRMTHCRTAAEAEKAFKENKVAAFLSMEGAELMGCSLDSLQKAYNMGVRAVNPTWNHANALSGSHMEEPTRGLSDLGKQYVTKMQELGMLVDVSHLSDPGFWDVIGLAKKPIIATHSDSRAVCPHTRNLTDEQFTALMQNQGVTGLNAYTRFLGEGEVTEETLIAHLEHFLSMGGEKNVALGGDWDGCDSLPKGYSGVWSWASLYESLLKLNYPEKVVKDLFYGNMMRVVKKVCK